MLAANKSSIGGAHNLSITAPSLSLLLMMVPNITAHNNTLFNKAKQI